MWPRTVRGKGGNETCDIDLGVECESRKRLTDPCRIKRERADRFGRDVPTSPPCPPGAGPAAMNPPWVENSAKFALAFIESTAQCRPRSLSGLSFGRREYGCSERDRGRPLSRHWFGGTSTFAEKMTPSALPAAPLAVPPCRPPFRAPLPRTPPAHPSRAPLPARTGTRRHLMAPPHPANHRPAHPPRRLPPPRPTASEDRGLAAPDGPWEGGRQRDLHRPR